jgi:hypothetical protein
MIKHYYMLTSTCEFRFPVNRFFDHDVKERFGMVSHHAGMVGHSAARMVLISG